MIKVETVKDALLKASGNKVRGSQGHIGALIGCRVTVLNSVGGLESLNTVRFSTRVSGQLFLQSLTGLAHQLPLVVFFLI